MGLWQLTLYLSVLPSFTYAMSQFNLTAYKQMPPLYQLDDYDNCLQPNRNNPGIYCLVYAEILPNTSSTLWHQIETVSADVKHHYRHDHLFMGVCLERCKQLLRGLSKFQVQQLYGGKATDQELSAYYANIYKRDTDERLHYDRLVNSCLNRNFQRQYQLKLRSSIEYCERSDKPLEYDNLDISCVIVLLLLLTCNLASSFYDFRLKLRQPLNCQNNMYYQKKLSTNAHKWLTAFSLCRNYYRLVMPLENGISKDLRFFDAFRVIGVFMVVLGHTLMIFMTIQIDNPQFYEQFLYRFETSILQNGNTVIQIFFVMSAFLLYVNVSQRQLINTKTKITECIYVYFKVFFSRYFRLVPSLIILILFNGTLLSRLQDGPFWRHITEPERVFCRENWWKNMLFVNNYLLKESCAQQTWYMGADMQLFELFLIITIVTMKYPGVTRYINALIFVLTFAIPMGLTYYLKLEAVYHLNPETYRYLYFRNSETFYQIYPPFYTNLGGYLFGVLCAKLYLKSRCSTCPKRYRGILKYELSMWLLVSLAMGILFSGFIFIKHDYEKPSIWLALYAGIYKNLWIVICAGFVVCMFYKVGWIGYEICSLRIFRPLARISYQAFLWHVVVLRLLAGYFRQPIYINSFFIFCNVILAFVLTNVIAFVVALLVEYPMAQIMKLLLQPKEANKVATNMQNNSNETELRKI